MSILSVSTIQSANSTSDLTIRSANTGANAIVLFANGSIALPTVATSNIQALSANTANINNLTVSSITANGTVGSNGQVLTSNGTTTYWANNSGGNLAVFSLYLQGVI